MGDKKKKREKREGGRDSERERETKKERGTKIKAMELRPCGIICILSCYH